jgi:uncharacterized protein (TIGR02300 family)
VKLAFDSAAGSWQLANIERDADLVRRFRTESDWRLGKPGVFSVAKPEWGAKRICQDCGTKFYDMRRAEIICPKCEAVFQIVPPKPKRVQPAAKAPVAEVKAAPSEPAVAKGVVSGGDETDEIDEIGEIEDVVADDDDDDDDEDIIEDTSDLGDDDDDMAEVIQKPAPPDES